MNRQVPGQIAIVGNGRVARHMKHYFELVGQPHIQWFRNNHSGKRNRVISKLAAFKSKLKSLVQPKPKSLQQSIERASTVLLLIPDDQIVGFIKQHPELSNKTCVHFSGSLHTELASGCHPLMTFGSELYDLQAYQEIPFVVDEGVDFQALFPLLQNSIHTIKPEHKSIYHAYCVMAGNFSQMLWKAIGHELENMELPADLMTAYLQQNTQNFINNPATSATGPFVRGDYQTIEKHLQALAGNPLAGIYQAFYDLHQAPGIQITRRQS